MKNRFMRRFIPAVAMLMALFPGFLAAQERETASVGEDRKLEVLASFAKGASTIKTISSDFLQERRTSMLKEPLLATGRFFFEKPERLRWEFTKPVPSGFIINAERTKRWRDHPKQSQSFDIEKEPALKAIAGQVFAWARADFTWIENNYQILIGSEDQPTITLTPRSPEERKYIRHMALSFSLDLASIQSVEILERSGDSTRIRFVNIVLNAPLPESLF